MGFITNQWLKGDPERERGHHPVEGEVSGTPSRDGWSQRNDVFFRITIYREDDGDYQTVYLTQDEVGKILSQMVKVAEQSARNNVALAILKRLDDAELLQFMTTLLVERKKRGERGEGGESGELELNLDWDWDWIDN